MSAPQQTIGHYRIVSKLDEGGMGEVWCATDTRLDREVAIKVLPPAFAQDLMRMGHRCGQIGCPPLPYLRHQYAGRSGTRSGTGTFRRCCEKLEIERKYM